MGAERLREAAKLMRERAQACIDNDRAHPEETGGPDAHYSPAFIEDAFRQHSPVDPPYSDGCERAWELAGDHLASWHPAVALVVADWLDEALERWLSSSPGCYYEYQSALAVADAYLGTTDA